MIFKGKKIKKVLLAATKLLFFFLLFLTSCDSFISCSIVDNGRLSIMSYNAQTFFDAIEDGVEFDEFKGGKSAWSEERYKIRLERIKEVFYICGRECGLMPNSSPDIVALQEVENERVIRDISARFTGSNSYPYGVFVDDDIPSAFGVGLLSRYPIESVKIHQVESFGVPLRPLMEATVVYKEQKITIFSVHWKSKVGNGSEYIRIAQENLLLERIKEIEKKDKNALWFACGDFNQRLHEFEGMRKYKNNWEADFSQFYGFDNRTLGTGSFFYAGSWEDIDHFFLSKTLCDGIGIEARESSIVLDSKLLTASNMPFRYDVFSGRGYSDHLPIVLVLDGFK